MAEVYPGLVVRGKDGQVETVQYYKLDAMLLNEVQRLAKARAADRGEIEELKSQIAEQQKQIAARNRDRDDERSELARLRTEMERLAAMVRTSNPTVVQASARPRCTPSVAVFRIRRVSTCSFLGNRKRFDAKGQPPAQHLGDEWR